MHVLNLHGRPIVMAERWERLSMEMARYTPDQQAAMTITSVPELD